MNLGATHHATLRRNVFVKYHNEDFGVVKIGNKDISQIASSRDVHLETKRIDC